MKHSQIIIIAAVITALGALILSCSLQTQGPASLGNLSVTETRAAEGVSVVEVPSPSERKTSTPGLEDRLAQIVAAYRTGDSAKLAALGGERYVDLKNSTAHVILEMDTNPDARADGTPTIESVTLPDGRKVEVQHAPIIVIRSDLAQAIAATGATYETAYENNVQVLAPFGSLEALARIPGVCYVRLPYPDQP